MKQLSSPCKFRESSPFKRIRRNKDSCLAISTNSNSSNLVNSYDPDLIDLTALNSDGPINLTGEFDDENSFASYPFVEKAPKKKNSIMLEFNSPKPAVRRGDGRGPQKDIGIIFFS